MYIHVYINIYIYIYIYISRLIQCTLAHASTVLLVTSPRRALLFVCVCPRAQAKQRQEGEILPHSNQRFQPLLNPSEAPCLSRRSTSHSTRRVRFSPLGPRSTINSPSTVPSGRARRSKEAASTRRRGGEPGKGAGKSNNNNSTRIPLGKAKLKAARALKQVATISPQAKFRAIQPTKKTALH